MSKALLAQFLGTGNTLSVSKPLFVLTGDLAAALFLGECLFWSDWAEQKADTPDHAQGFFHRSHADWYEKTGLTDDQMKRVKNTCLRYGLRYELRGIPATGHYRVDGPHLLELLERMRAGEPLADIRERGDQLYSEYLAQAEPKKGRVGGRKAARAQIGGKPLSSKGESPQPEGGKAPSHEGEKPLTSATVTPLSNTEQTQIKHNSNTPPLTPQGEREGGQKDLNPQEPKPQVGDTARPLPLGQSLAGQESQRNDPVKSSARRAAPAAGPDAATLADWAAQVVAAFNDNRGELLAVETVTEGRKKAVALFVGQCTGGISEAVAVMAQAAAYVGRDQFWVDRKAYMNFDKLIGRAHDRAEAARQLADTAQRQRPRPAGLALADLAKGDRVAYGPYGYDVETVGPDYVGLYDENNGAMVVKVATADEWAKLRKVH